MKEKYKFEKMQYQTMWHKNNVFNLIISKLSSITFYLKLSFVHTCIQTYKQLPTTFLFLPIIFILIKLIIEISVFFFFFFWRIQIVGVGYLNSRWLY